MKRTRSTPREKTWLMRKRSTPIKKPARLRGPRETAGLSDQNGSGSTAVLQGCDILQAFRRQAVFLEAAVG